MLLVSTAFGIEPTVQTGYYQGTLGDHLQITMTLGVHEGEFTGQYRYSNHGAPIWLRQTGDTSNAQVHLLESEGVDHVPVFDGVITETQSFAGTWTSGDRKRTLKFNLPCIAELAHQASDCPRYKVETDYPQFTEKSDFYAALNAQLASDAKAQMESTVADSDKNTAGADPGPLPWESFRKTDVIYADDSLVSLCTINYEYTGGAHGNSTYDAAVYTWRDHHLLKLAIGDLLHKSALATLNNQLIKDLTRRKASWPQQAKDVKFDEEVVNPTSAGLMFTFAPYTVGPYAEGSYTVLLPYRNLDGIMKTDGVLGRFMQTVGDKSRVSQLQD
jgi:hypothetical protein